MNSIAGGDRLKGETTQNPNPYKHSKSKPNQTFVTNIATAITVKVSSGNALLRMRFSICMRSFCFKALCVALS